MYWILILSMSSVVLSMELGWSTGAMVPSITKVGDTAELFCLVRDTWWVPDKPVNVNWFWGKTKIDPATDTRMAIRNVTFTSSIGRCTVSDPPAGKGLDSDESKECTVSVLTITGVKSEDYGVYINCTWTDDDKVERFKIGSILNPAEKNPVTILSTATEQDVVSYSSAECASNSEIFWYVSFENGVLIDVNGPKNLLKDWLPTYFPQNSSWQKGSLYESIMVVDFRGFLQGKVSLHCGANPNSTIDLGADIGEFRSDRQYDMETTMLERKAWLVVFAVPVLVFVALFVASKRVGIWSGDDSCFQPCIRDYEQIRKPRPSATNA